MEWAPYDYQLSEEDYNNPLIRPEIKVADASYHLNQIVGNDNAVMMYFPPNGEKQPYARSEKNYIIIFYHFFGKNYNNDVSLDNEYRKSITFHEYNHKINGESGEYPGAYKVTPINTGIKYYQPYSEKDLKDYNELGLTPNPKGELRFFTYRGSNTEREHRDVYQSQIQGHIDGRYNLSESQIKELTQNVEHFQKLYELALDYEKTNNLTPEGKKIE